MTGPLAPILTGMLAADPADRPTMAQARAQLVKAAGDLTTVRVAEQPTQVNADELVTARVTNQPPAAPLPPAPMPRIPDSRTRVTRTDERKRGRAGLIATICVVVLLVVVTGILATRALNQPLGGNAGGGHSSSGSTTPNVPEVGVDPAAKLDYSHMRVALSNYYALLPGDPNDAFDLLSPGYQKKTGFQNFVKFYAGINEVTVRDILPLGPGNVSGVVTFVKEGGGTTHELYHFTFTIDHDKLLISNAVRVGGA